MQTEAGNYQTFQATNGKWFYHPTDNGWLAFNANDSFSQSYDSEAEALADAELKEEMDAEGLDEVIFDSDTGTFRP